MAFLHHLPQNLSSSLPSLLHCRPSHQSGWHSRRSTCDPVRRQEEECHCVDAASIVGPSSSLTRTTSVYCVWAMPRQRRECPAAVHTRICQTRLSARDLATRSPMLRTASNLPLKCRTWSLLDVERMTLCPPIGAWSEGLMEEVSVCAPSHPGATADEYSLWLTWPRVVSSGAASRRDHTVTVLPSFSLSPWTRDPPHLCGREGGPHHWKCVCVSRTHKIGPSYTGDSASAPNQNCSVICAQWQTSFFVPQITSWPW